MNICICLFTGQWFVQQVNPATHAPIGAPAEYATDFLLNTYVTTLPYGTMLLIGHSGGAGTSVCGAACATVLPLLGGTAFPTSGACKLHIRRNRKLIIIFITFNVKF